MSTESIHRAGRFRQLQPTVAGAAVRFTFNGLPCAGESGSSVAAALLAIGIECFRHTPVSGAPRAPYCMMGVCFECLVEIDGRPNRQACLVEVREGMAIRTQQGARAPLPMDGADDGH
jgi:D-hydroxyproline dehydrogenase subunit gamma